MTNTNKPYTLHAAVSDNHYLPDVYRTMARGVLHEMAGTNGVLLFHCHADDVAVSGLPKHTYHANEETGRVSIAIAGTDIDVMDDCFVIYGVEVDLMALYGFVVGNEPLIFVLAGPYAPEPYAVRSTRDFYDNRQERSDKIMEEIAKGSDTKSTSDERPDLTLVHSSDTIH